MKVNRYQLNLLVKVCFSAWPYPVARCSSDRKYLPQHSRVIFAFWKQDQILSSHASFPFSNRLFAVHVSTLNSDDAGDANRGFTMTCLWKAVFKMNTFQTRETDLSHQQSRPLFLGEHNELHYCANCSCVPVFSQSGYLGLALDWCAEAARHKLQLWDRCLGD